MRTLDENSIAGRVRAFVAAHPGALAREIGNAVGGHAAIHVAHMAVCGQLTRRREPGGMWRYYPPTRTSRASSNVPKGQDK